MQTPCFEYNSEYQQMRMRYRIILLVSVVDTLSFCSAEPKFDARGSMHHSTIRKEKSNKMQQCIKIFIIPYLYEVQHVSGDTPPIIRSLKLHWQPLVFHMWKIVGRVVVGSCQAQDTVPDNFQQLHVHQPSTYEKPEAASAVLGS
jgi:hypothetical protein